MASSKDEFSMEDSVGTIILFQKGQAEVASCMRLITKLDESSSTTITHGYDTSDFDTASNLIMGKLVVHKQRMTLPSAKYVPLPLRHLKAIGWFNIRLPSDRFACSSCGIVFLPGGCIAVADKENKNIKLYKEDGDFLDAIDLSGKPCELCRVDNCTVAAIVSTGTINVFKVSNSKLSLTSSIKVDITAGTKCHGITCCNDAFVVGTSTSLFYVRQNGRKEHIHKIGSSCLHLASDQRSGNIFFSLEGNMPNWPAVSRLYSRTITNILPTGTLKEARGIDVDREKNVYVCGFVSNNVIQMSQDGSHVRELLTSSDGINKPRAISVWEDKVVITNQSPNQRNTVKLFRLV
ncbi:uncharacterized protein [Argopecten irradians]|uniref:uncharacterized protein n=1 Tax=Argopecten irradians TaxID=31199 RepID=UPI00371A8D03